VVLPDPLIHLYWAYALARAEEMLKVSTSHRASAARRPSASTSPWTRSGSPQVVQGDGEKEQREGVEMTPGLHPARQTGRPRKMIVARMSRN
jgi:hypothetical protein